MNPIKAILFLLISISTTLMLPCAKAEPSVDPFRVADAYHQYLSDLMQVESKLFLDPSHPLVYSASGSDDAKLLKSVLDERRFQPILEIYKRKQADGTADVNLVQLLEPLTQSYLKAFSTFGVRYENEFLDTTQMSIAVLMTSTPASGSKKSIPTTTTALDTSTEKKRKAIESSQKLLKALESFSENLRSMVAKQLNDLVEKKKLTPSGEKRVQEMVHQLLKKTSE